MQTHSPQGLAEMQLLKSIQPLCEIYLLILKHQCYRDRGSRVPFLNSLSLLKLKCTIFFFFFLFSVGTIFALSFCLLQNTSVSQRGASSGYLYITWLWGSVGLTLEHPKGL